MFFWSKRGMESRGLLVIWGILETTSGIIGRGRGRVDPGHEFCALRSFLLCRGLCSESFELIPKFRVVCPEFLDPPEEMSGMLKRGRASSHLSLFLFRLDHFPLCHRVIVVYSSMHSS